MIEAADPGYDWIFSHEIAGIPAVIGVGEKLFARFSAAHVLELDCANKQVKILQ